MRRSLLAPLLGLVPLATPVCGQSDNCAPRAQLVERLEGHFGEVRQSAGLAPGNRIVEMFASPRTGTWTLTLTLPDGRSCIIGAGEAFRREADHAAPVGQPT